MLCFVMGMNAFASAQNETVFQDWTSLEESTQLIDVSYRIVKCTEDASIQIHFHIFNENPEEKTLSFSLEITDGNGNSETIEVNGLNLEIGEMRIADCSDANPEIKVDFPTNLDANTASVEIHYQGE